MPDRAPRSPPSAGHALRPSSFSAFFSRPASSSSRSHSRSSSADAMSAVSLDSPPSTPTPRSSMHLHTPPDLAASPLSHRKPGRLRARRVECWIEDQHHAAASTSSSLSSPYMAYPDLYTSRLLLTPAEEDEGTESFVFVLEEPDDDDGVDGDGDRDEPQRREREQEQEQETTRAAASAGRPSSPRLSSSSFRLPLASVRHRLSPSPPPRSRVLFPRPPSSMSSSLSLHHHRTDSATTTAGIPSPPSSPSPQPSLMPSPRSLRTSFKLRRPSVFSSFSTSAPDDSPPLSSSSGSSPYAHPDIAADEPSRPSFTSSRTFSSSTTTQTSADHPSTPPPPPSSLFPPTARRRRSLKPPPASPSLWSLPVDASHMSDAPNSETSLATDPAAAATTTRKLAAALVRPSAHTLRGILPLAVRPPRKVLVVSGIEPGEDERVEYLLEWCEGFGEVKEIVRVANGDLHVDFRKAEVADTVCRLTARVQIPKVGSVALSHKLEKKR